MFNLGVIMKAVGVKIAPDKLAQIEAMIPQIPAKVNELINFNAAAVRRYDEKLEEIHQKQILLAGQLNQIKEMIADGQRSRDLQRTGVTVFECGDGSGTNGAN